MHYILKSNIKWQYIPKLETGIFQQRKKSRKSYRYLISAFYFFRLFLSIWKLLYDERTIWLSREIAKWIAKFMQLSYVTDRNRRRKCKWAPRVRVWRRYSTIRFKSTIWTTRDITQDCKFARTSFHGAEVRKRRKPQESAIPCRAQKTYRSG